MENNNTKSSRMQQSMSALCPAEGSPDANAASTNLPERISAILAAHGYTVPSNICEQIASEALTAGDDVLTKAGFEEIAQSWDGCEGEGIHDIGEALRLDFGRLAIKASAAKSAPDAEVPGLEHTTYADIERISVEALWHRWVGARSPASILPFDAFRAARELPPKNATYLVGQPPNTSLLKWALGELLDALPTRRDWFNPDAEKVLRELRADSAKLVLKNPARELIHVGTLSVFEDKEATFGYAYDISNNQYGHQVLQKLDGAELYVVKAIGA